ncbi:MAG: hypothetical protein WC005_07225 [Candidatus Nanopelagicales bacterium]
MSTVEFTQALHALVRELDDAAEEVLQGDFGITHSQLAFLMPLLSHGELDVSSLAAFKRVSIPAVSKRIKWFVDRSLIRAVHPAGDAKRVILSLTPQGKRLATSASGRLASRLDELLATWPDDRRSVFHDLVLEVTWTIRANRGLEMKELE